LIERINKSETVKQIGPLLDTALPQFRKDLKRQRIGWLFRILLERNQSSCGLTGGVHGRRSLLVAST